MMRILAAAVAVLTFGGLMTVPADAAPAPVMNGYRPVEVSPGLQPWRRDRTPEVDTGLKDSAGVRLFRAASDGQLHDHPVAQAQYGLHNLHTFRLTGEQLYLDRARAQADRNINRRVESRGAWWFPYPFDFQLGEDPDIQMVAPWYSGMSQGELLSLFVQLAQTPEVPADRREVYARVAGYTFESLLLDPAPDVPWVMSTDTDGYRWIQEYPQDPPETSDHTMNGMLFALLGVWDYWNVTKDPRAADLFDAVASTAVRYMPDIRTPGWASSYCLRHHPDPHLKYHEIHTWQILQVSWLTGGRLEPARLADQLSIDFPARAVTGQVRFKAGAHTVYSFDKEGAITGQKTFTLPDDSAAPADQRARIKGRGIYVRATAGIAAGYWVPEHRTTAYMIGEHVTLKYFPDRRAGFAAGQNVAGYEIDSDTGAITGVKSMTPSAPTGAPYSRRAVVNGTLSVLITAGYFANHWIAVSAITP